RLRDANGHSISGDTVSLNASPGSHAAISPPSGVSTVGNGAVVFFVTDTNIEDVTFTAAANGVALTQTTTGSFGSPPATSGGIVAAPRSVLADGRSRTTITVTLQDAKGHGTPGKLIALAQGSGHSILTGPSPAVTDASGQIQFTATNDIG